MAFSFSNAAAGGGGGGVGSATPAGAPAQVREGPELQEIQTDQLGFCAINGEAQLKLLPTPWPADALPSPTSSLLAVASSKGLIAAAGPDILVVTSTESVREAFRLPAVSKTDKIRPINPALTISKSRLAHVVFSSDESVLVVSDDQGGGLSAFQVDSIFGGQTNPALQISTNGTAIRALVPNPAPESAELFAAVTSGGDLVMADLKAGGLRSGVKGPVLKSGVSCVSWSNKGKQLVAGLADGTITQMKPDGSLVAEIPKSPSLSVDVHVSGISWLENDSFFIIYTPNDTSNPNEPSEYFIITREPKTSNYVFQRLPEIIPAFGMERTPTYHFISRLRTFPPHVQDLLLLSATTGQDVGIISKADKSLSQNENITEQFTFTTINDDTRRAQLPLNKESMDTSPIGMALDLSSTEKVPNPIPSDLELLETDGPVPNLLILNNEGVLTSWWFIYADSVRQKTLFSGMSSGIAAAVVQKPAQVAPEPSPALRQASPAAPSSTFGQPAFGGATAFGKPTTIGSSKPSWASTGFGAESSKQSNGFGFGQPAFGSTTPMGNANAPAFGAASAIPSKPGPFGSAFPSSGKPSTFGSQSGAFGGTSTASPFGGTPAATSTSSGFASFSNANGFGGFGGAEGKKTESPFATGTENSVFGRAQSNSPFAPNNDKPSVFGTAKPIATASPFATAGTSFKLESSFKSDGTGKDDLTKPKPKQSSGFGFGGGFGDLLNEPEQPLSPTHDKEAEMGDGEDESGSESAKADQSHFAGFSSTITKLPLQSLVTPPSTLMQSKSTPAAPVSGLFGNPVQTTTPLPHTTTPAWSFGQVPSTTPKETPAASHSTLFGTTPQQQLTPAAVQTKEPAPIFGGVPQVAAPQSVSKTPPPAIKQEPPSDEESIKLSQIPEAPLPPDTISKPRYRSGDTSASSNITQSPPEDAPLPPDFLPANKSAAAPPEQPTLPSDDDEFSSDFEGSEEDVTDDVSPIEGSDDAAEQIQTSPESSFKSGERSPETSPTGGLFTKVSTTAGQKPHRPLFGEVGSGPIFPPPKPHESPRSPSPVRHLIPTDTLRAEAARSVSAPAHPRSIIDKRKTEYAQSALASQAARAKEEEAAKENDRQAENARVQAEAAAKRLDVLEDDEDQRLWKELESPIAPTANLDGFITYQPSAAEDSAKSGIPAQIERLYRDINSMVYTLGINARSLSAFMQYQTDQEVNQSWPSVLSSDMPMDALNDEWVLGDITRLGEGRKLLADIAEESQVQGISSKLHSCQALLGRDLFELRTKLTSVRKTLHTKNDSDSTIAAPLSAEQASIQHDLRKASVLVQTRLVQVEDQLSVLRAKLAEISPMEAIGKRQSMVLGRSTSQKKPTVEAVTHTVAKMTAMAEKKSADIDVLEAKLKQLDMSAGNLSNGSRHGSSEPSSTPNQRKRSAMATPASATNSVYHTPDSKFSGSLRSTPVHRLGAIGNTSMVSTEDRERWRTKARRKKDVADILKEVLDERRTRASVKA